MKRHLGLITLATLYILTTQSRSLANKVMPTSSPEVRGITGKVALLSKNRVKRNNTERISNVGIIGESIGGEGGIYDCTSLAECNRNIKLDPKSSGRYLLRARFKADNLQNYRGAMADYDRAIQMSPKCADHYYSRGEFKADKLHDYKGAMSDYNRGVQMYPNESYSYLSRAQFKLRTLEDYQGGDADCSLALKYASNSDEVNITYMTCRVYLHTDKWVNPSLK
jgi:hypothetical protein